MCQIPRDFHVTKFLVIVNKPLDSNPFKTHVLSSSFLYHIWPNKEEDREWNIYMYMYFKRMVILFIYFFIFLIFSYFLFFSID
jgi:hypothetical protein